MPPLPPTEALTRTQEKAVAARGRVRNPRDLSKQTQATEQSTAPPPIAMTSSTIQMSAEEDRHNEDEEEASQQYVLANMKEPSWVDLDSTLSDGFSFTDRSWGSQGEERKIQKEEEIRHAAFSDAPVARRSVDATHSTRSSVEGTAISPSLGSNDGSLAATPLAVRRTGSAAEDGFQALLAKTKKDLDDLKKRLQAAKQDHVPTPSPRVHRKFHPAA